MDLYPSADSYVFNISPEKHIDQNLYVYHVKIWLDERGKPWGFYLTELDLTELNIVVYHSRKHT